MGTVCACFFGGRLFQLKGIITIAIFLGTPCVRALLLSSQFYSLYALEVIITDTKMSGQAKFHKN
jgi:hypothetical protein